MARERRRKADDGPIDFDEGLPDHAGSPSASVARRSPISKRRSYDRDSDVGEGHARGEPGARYRDELNFDDGLPVRRIEKSEAPAPETIEKAPQKTTIQTLIFSKEKFTRAQATKWATDHDFRADKVDETDTSFRLRQKDPGEFQEGSFRTITLTAGVQAVIGRPAKAAAKKRDGLRAEEYAEHRGNVPAVLTWDAVRKGELPALGDPGMPESLAGDIPPKFRFWKCATRDEAIRVREALVESALFTEETIREVDGVQRRAVPEVVVKLFLPPVYDDAAPPEVPPKLRAVEKVAALLAPSESERQTTLFDEDVIEAVGLPAIMEKVRSLRGDWVIAAKDSPEVRKSIGGPAFKIASRSDLVFATSAELADPSAVEWVTHTREDEILKFALAEGRTIRLLKAKKKEGEQRIVFGVVLEPDEVDAQGDTISKEEIETAAHKFMEDFQNLGLQHREIVNGRLKLLESFIAPTPFDVEGQVVKAGSWLMKERVIDDELWAAVKKGKFTGFSIGGSAIRKPTG